MRPLPSTTRYLHPKSIEEALAMKADHPEGGRFVAGGTDLLWNLKQGLGPVSPVLIDLSRLQEEGLRGLVCKRDTIELGSLATLAEIASSRELASLVPDLVSAAGCVASPPIRTAATLGGNVALDTRCFYYNQNALWREALGGCLKAEGMICHVTGGHRACVARRAGDTVAPLLLRGASVRLVTRDGEIVIPLGDYLTRNGLFGPHVSDPNAFIRSVVIPRPQAGFLARYVKVAPRNAIDFPEVGLAIGAAFEGRVCETVTVVISAVRPHPRVMTFSVAGELSLEVITHITHQVERGVKPLTNIQGDTHFQSWRARVAGVEVSRVLSGFAQT